MSNQQGSFSLEQLRDRLRREVEGFDGLGELSQETTVLVAYLKQISTQSRNLAVNMVNLGIMLVETTKITSEDGSYEAVLAAFKTIIKSFNLESRTIDGMVHLDQVVDDCVVILRDVLNSLESLKIPAEGMEGDNAS